MRSSRRFIIALGAAVLAASTVAVAGAFISSSNDLIILSSPPSSVVKNALEHATSAVAFAEAQGVALDANVAVDATDPGVYSVFPNGSAEIASGTVVDSHLIHSDPIGSGSNRRRTGSIGFPSVILGVIADTDRLASTDAALGAPGTLYSGTQRWRGLESGDSDSFIISEDRRELSFSLRTASVIDELRIVTVHVNQLTLAISDSPDPVQAGNDVGYTLTVTNHAATTASAVQVQDSFPGATLVSATASGGCTGTATVTCDLGDIAAGASAVASVVVTSPTTVPGSGTIENTASAPPGQDPVTETTSVVPPILTTTIADSPDPVTAGNDVQYTVTVTNDGIGAVADAHAVDTLPAGTSLVTASAAGGCTGASIVDCSLGSIAVGDSAQAVLVVTSPGAVPVGDTITNTAVASPGTNPVASEITTVEATEPGVSKGFVIPGGSITIPGDNPATITLPGTGSGAPVVITQGEGSFCNGPCVGPATTISDFPGYSDPNHPIHLTLTYTFPDGPSSLTDAATAYGATIYKNDDPLSPTVGAPVPFCTAMGSGVAAPHPCIDARSIVQPTLNSFVVTFEVVYLSGDPRFARR